METIQIHTPPVYIPGLASTALARSLNIDPQQIVKLASNEAPIGPSHQVIAAVQAALTQAHIYPESNAYTLRESLAHKFNLEPTQLTFGPGSESVLALIGQALLQPGDEVVTSEYAFIAYEMIASANRAQLVKIPALNFGHDLRAMAKACHEKTKIVFLANPNNPTGTWFDEAELVQFLTTIPSHVVVVIDEAYYEFMEHVPGYPNSLNLLKLFPNLIITRTFSKAYSLAGFRVGYAISSPHMASTINKARMPFNVSEPAIAAANAALNDTRHLKKVNQIIAIGKNQLARGFNQLGLSYLPASANFFLVEFGKHTRAVYQYLLNHHIIVRPVENYGLLQHLRITIGNVDDNAKLLEQLKNYYGELNHV